MGKLGGNELNYSSDIDLVFLYDADGDGRLRPRAERPASSVRPIASSSKRLAQDVVKLLGESTPLGAAYRVDLRLRPEGERGPLVARSTARCSITTCSAALGNVRRT